MITSSDIALAFALDLAVGDPRWIPHPVVIIGKGISFLESFLRRIIGRNSEKLAGVALTLIIVVATYVVAYYIELRLTEPTDGAIGLIKRAFYIYLVSTTIALKGLVDSARLVIEAIKDGLMEDARKYLSMIVGRDTAGLSSEGASKAVVETLAENLSDGVIAPIFFLAIGGFPLAMAYKAVNTLDSMVGYKNEKYMNFGWASARLDDIANYIPARLSGILICCAAFFAKAKSSKAWGVMLRDGRNHTSPNSGVPESAMAGALGVRLGGPSTYGGVLIAKPFIGDEGTTDYESAALKAIKIVRIASWIAMVLAVIIVSLRSRA